MIISLSLLPSLSVPLQLSLFNSCSVKQKFSHPPKKFRGDGKRRNRERRRKKELFARRSEKNSRFKKKKTSQTTIQCVLFLPDLVALVLVADGQQVQQDLIEVA